MSESGFEIKGTFYAFPTAFRIGDPPLVRQITGMSWEEFTGALGDDTGDPSVSAGMIAVAVWQTNPEWRRDRVARFVEKLDMEQVKFISGDAADEEETVVPPPETDAAPNGSPTGTDVASETSTSEPNGTPDSSSDPTLVSGGAPG